MTVNLATGIIHQQRPDQYTQRMFLPHRPRIRQPAPLTDSPLIAYPDTLRIMSTRMRPYFLYGTGCFYIPVLADIKMISGSVHSTPAVAHLQILFGKVPVRLCGGTVDNNQINHPHPPMHELIPTTPAIAVATAITTFKIVLQTDLPFILQFFFKIKHLSAIYLSRLLLFLRFHRQFIHLRIFQCCQNTA